MTPSYFRSDTRIRRSVAGSLVLVFFVIAVFSTRAYVLEGPKWPNGSTVAMQLSLGNPAYTLSDGNTNWNVAVAPALDAWNQIMGGMQFAQVMNSTAAVVSGDRVNSMAFASTNFGHSFGSNTLAITTYWGSSTMIEADILFNSAQSWDSYRGPLRSAIDIQRVALHELGHVLGLDHSTAPGAIMNAYITDAYTLSADDINGAQALYGAASGPTPTPTPSATAAPTPTITPSPTATPSTLFVSLSADPTIVQPGASAVFTVTALNNASSPVTVNYRMSGTAKFGLNYLLSGTRGQIIIPAGANSGSVTLTVLSGAKRAKTATMNLQLGSGYAVSGSSTASVIITR
jgi:predicted Zn-dependent protease